MAPTLLQVMDGLVTRLRTIEGLTVTRHMPGSVTPDHAVVGVPPITEYHSTMGRGLMTLAPTVTVFTGDGDAENGQLALALYADTTGAKSIRAAIEADRTLGGVVSDCVVQSFDPQGLDDEGGLNLYVGVFSLLCVAPGV